MKYQEALTLLKDLSKPTWTPLPYQTKAVNLLLSKPHSGLFLDPGMGKTSIVLTAAKQLLERGEIDCMIVIAPLRVVGVAWPGELDKWADFEGMTYGLAHGPKRGKVFQQDLDVYLTNYDCLRTSAVVEMANLMNRRRCMLVIDESTGFKRANTMRFKVLKELIKAAPRRHILTGTPMPNGIEGLWSQVYILDEGHALGKNITRFRYNYMVPNPYIRNVWEPQFGALQRVTEKIDDFVYQLKASDYLSLPDAVVRLTKVDLPPKARKQYESMERELIAELPSGGSVISANSLAKIGRLHQITNGALYDDEGRVHHIHDAKIEALVSIVEELDGNPCLILYQFEHDYKRICKAFPSRDIPTLSNTTPRQANNLCSQFVTNQLPVLCGHPASMGHGLNLQGGSAHHIIWFGLQYNLEHWLQANQRLVRQGNTSPAVFIHCIVAGNTVDYVAWAALQQKNTNQDLFMSYLTDTLTTPNN